MDDIITGYKKICEQCGSEAWIIFIIYDGIKLICSNCGAYDFIETIFNEDK
jgi:hypothetical protein